MYCIVVGPAYPYRGGIAHMNALLAATLSTRHRVEVITFSRQYPTWLYRRITGSPTQVETLESAPAILPERLIDSVNPVSWFTTGREIRRRNPDLLIFRYSLPFFGPSFGTVARFARHGDRPRILFICDNILPHETRPLDAAFARYAFRQADLFLVQSEAVARELEQFWPGGIHTIAPHPTYTLFGEGIPKEEARKALGVNAQQVLLFFGYVRKYKGLDLLINAMARVVRETNVQLLVAGEFYDPVDQFREQVQRLGLSDRVLFFPGYIPKERVRLYFSAADAVVLPYRSASQSGIAQIAYNFDKPVIATIAGGLAEVVKDGRTGYLVAVGDEEALATAILRFYQAGGESAFTHHVRKEKERYSWEQYVGILESFVEQAR